MTLYRALLLTLLATLTQFAYAAGNGGDRGVLLRDAELHAEADASSTVLARLSVGTTLDVLGRNGLWMFAAHETAAGRTQGWVRLTRLRLTGASAQVAPGSSGVSGGFARLSRSIGGLLGGFRSRQSESGSVATIGVRGLTPGELKTAHFDAAALGAVAAAVASNAEAENFARAGGLDARAVAELDKQPTTGGATR